jgi:hypothetical protein
MVQRGVSLKASCRETGLAPASIQRFVCGIQSMQLDMANWFAAFFEISPESRR